MLSLIALALLMGAPQTPAVDDFSSRVTRAKLAEGAATGPAYQKLFWEKTGDPMTDTLKGCIKSNTPADKSPFTLVADISPDGHPLRVEVRVPTPVAKCVAGQFSAWTFPKPPVQADQMDYPIEIDVSVVP